MISSLGQHGLWARFSLQTHLLRTNSPVLWGPPHILESAPLHPPLRHATLLMGGHWAQLSCLVSRKAFPEKSQHIENGRKGSPVVLCFCPASFYTTNYRVSPGCVMSHRFPLQSHATFSWSLCSLTTFHCSVWSPSIRTPWLLLWFCVIFGYFFLFSWRCP